MKMSILWLRLQNHAELRSLTTQCPSINTMFISCRAVISTVVDIKGVNIVHFAHSLLSSRAASASLNNHAVEV